MEGLTEGRIVHYVVSERDLASRAAGEHCPAMVVRVFDKTNGLANLLVFLDGSNSGVVNAHTMWVTSRHYSESPAPSTWHWIEKA